MTAKARLTIGLPVYNGSAFLARSLESLLGQTFDDFELIISDNASSDDTPAICRAYARQDSRIRYFRQPQNIGAAGNHNFVASAATTEFFKFASHDDVYARDLLKRCVDALDEYPKIVLAHSWTAMIDDDATVTMALEYPLATSSPRAPERFRSMLMVSGGDDIYGVMRRSRLQGVLNHGSYYRAYRVMMCEVSLRGPFYQVPEWLYFRREHPELRVWPGPNGQKPRFFERDWPVGRAAVVNLDPSRANRFLHPTARLYTEYVWGYVAAIRRSPLSPADRKECFRYLREWFTNRLFSRSEKPAEVRAVRCVPVDLSVESVVAGWPKPNG